MVARTCSQCPPSNEWDSILEGAMFEILITSFVAAFLLVALFGHVMVAKALMKPDQTA